MSLPQGSYSRAFVRARPPFGRQRGPILAVGWRVVVTCPGGGSNCVTLTDMEGTTPLATVADGLEVEILAWQPFGAGGIRYRVLSVKGGVEGWLGAASLRPSQLPRSPIASGSGEPSERAKPQASPARGAPRTARTAKTAKRRTR
jgi:hypothetical protein